jgi:hypothetical protein
MTYSQLLYRVAAAAIALCATYFLVTDRLCMLSKIDGCRPVHGLSAIALFLAAVAFAASLLIASTQPRRGARLKNLLAAWILFVVLYAAAFVLDLVKVG